MEWIQSYFDLIIFLLALRNLSPNTLERLSKILFPNAGYLFIRVRRSVLKNPINLVGLLQTAEADLGSSSSKANSPKKSPDVRLAKIFPDFGSLISYETLKNIGDIKQITKYLRLTTYSLDPQFNKN